MIRTIAACCALVLLALTAGSALAQGNAVKPFKATDYPVAVRKVLSEAVLFCRQQDGGKLEFAPDTVRKIDLNGDGRIDYVVSFRKVICPEMRHIFCGTGGCGTHFMVTQPNGTIRVLYADNIHNYRMLRRKGPGWVRFSVHHSDCDGGPTKECLKDVRIGYKPFTPR
jgi:hypothetical protein